MGTEQTAVGFRVKVAVPHAEAVEKTIAALKSVGIASGTGSGG
jgi:hypothetical protein